MDGKTDCIKLRLSLKVNMRDNLGRFIKGHRLSEESLKKLSDTVKAKGVIPPSRRGIKMSEESKVKMHHPAWNKGTKGYKAGKLHYNWKGGITPINVILRTGSEYINWRIAVFERDYYTCQMCGKVGGYLEADHIKPWSLYPELRFDINNGQTLCKIPCHNMKTKEDRKEVRLASLRSILK
jgi:hypothetical protein